MKKISPFVLPLALLGVVFFLGGCGYQSASQSTTPAPNSAANTPATPSPSSSATKTPSPATGQVAGAVTIQNFAFSPAEITIAKGETVTWTNEDSSPHQIASDNGKFQGPSFSKGQTYSFTFNDTGAFPYHCAIHPMMKGNIVVK